MAQQLGGPGARVGPESPAAEQARAAVVRHRGKAQREGPNRAGSPSGGSCAQPYPSATHLPLLCGFPGTRAALAWPPCSGKAFSRFFFQDGLKHKQSPWWASGLRGPLGSIRCFVISPETAGAEGGVGGGHGWSAGWWGRPAGQLAVYLARPGSHIHPVTVAREAPVFLHRKFTAWRWRAWPRASSSPPCFDRLEGPGGQEPRPACPRKRGPRQLASPRIAL